mgnify:CR=1
MASTELEFLDGPVGAAPDAEMAIDASSPVHFREPYTFLCEGALLAYLDSGAWSVFRA